MVSESLKKCTDEEIIEKFRRCLARIRSTEYQYGIIRFEVSGGKVKFMTVEIQADEI